MKKVSIVPGARIIFSVIVCGVDSLASSQVVCWVKRLSVSMPYLQIWVLTVHDKRFFDGMLAILDLILMLIMSIDMSFGYMMVTSCLKSRSSFGFFFF